MVGVRVTGGEEGRSSANAEKVWCEHFSALKEWMLLDYITRLEDSVGV